MPKICIIGHITKDHVITSKSEKFIPGGSAYYCSKALLQLKAELELITAVGQNEIKEIQKLQKEGLLVHAIPSEYSSYFQNIYSENQDQRTQNILSAATPFTSENIPTIDAEIVHLGPLLKQDVAPNLIQKLSRNHKISLDIQGLLRESNGKRLEPSPLLEKEIFLTRIHTLKANLEEAQQLSDKGELLEIAEELSQFGIQEVIITMGSHGSIVYADEHIYEIPAFKPKQVVDATGCGDTYMAGYLFKRSEGSDIEEAGRFGAAMATLKIEHFGAFSGNCHQIENLLTNHV